MHVNSELLERRQIRNTLSGDTQDFGDAGLVMVGARLPVDTLFADLSKMQSIERLETAGDCVAPGTIQAAVLSGHTVARSLLSGTTTHTAFKREQLFT